MKSETSLDSKVQDKKKTIIMIVWIILKSVHMFYL